MANYDINYDFDFKESLYRETEYIPGSNGLTGFQKYECYMLIKFGNQNNFGISGDKEYLIDMPIYPESVTEQISAKWTTQPVLGRSSPIAAYASTDLKSVNFSLDLHRDLLTGSYSLSENVLRKIAGTDNLQAAGLQKQSAEGPFGTRDWYVRMNKMLQMACYPQYTDYGLIPPTTYFIFGQMILKGFINSYSTTWQKPIINTFYSNNRVDINMDCYPDSIIGAKEILTGPGALSTQNTYNTNYPTRDASTSDVMMRSYNKSSEFNQNYNARSASSLGGGVRQT